MSNRVCKHLLVTGGAGFIGSAFIRYLLQKVEGVEKVVNLDLLTYAGDLAYLAPVSSDPRYYFVHGDILSGPLVEEVIRTHSIDTIVHFAAESHVDRSIEDPKCFYKTNVEGTLSLLEVVRRFPSIHFHHISTDEVYGSVKEGFFTESSPYKPNSPYAASKAASDHFVRAYARTYGLSTTLSHSSNNYGPCQYPEKFIPLTLSALMGESPIPIYGEGRNVRDWLFVEDHAEGIWEVVQKGLSGESYNLGGGFEIENIDLAKTLIDAFASYCGESPKKYLPLISFVEDRPGHDFRYALSGKKMKEELGWEPRSTFEEGLTQTISWYMERAHG